MRFDKETRKKIYDKYNGHCAYCGCELEYKDMQVDHIIPKELMAREGYVGGYPENEIECMDNYNPSCRQCNFYKSTKSLEKFRHDLEETIWHNLDKMFNYRLLKKYNQIEEHKGSIKFYFEQ